MKELDYNGTKLVMLSKTEAQPFKPYDTLDCGGCYFFTGDAVGIVDGALYPSKQTRPNGYACEQPHTISIMADSSCFCIPKDYYERHKPKWKL